MATYTHPCRHTLQKCHPFIRSRSFSRAAGRRRALLLLLLGRVEQRHKLLLRCKLPKQVDEERDVVVPAPNILRPPPCTPLILQVHLALHLDRRRVARRQRRQLRTQSLRLARDDSHQVEADLGSGVALDARLDGWLDGLDPIGTGGKLAEQHRPRLETVEFVQLSRHRHVGDEVIEVVVLCRLALVVRHEGVGGREGVVRGAHKLGI
mmetsp:Transcript_8519/g.17149  ORF Transcript_8519/g.17149 Transcript_8519/m.17149 type:complete len:208 (-) Transcript_8519:416-1039(-)